MAANNWTPPRMWEGGTVYIIGGGPSLKQAAGLDPGEKNPAVIFTRVSKLLSPIHNRRVIGLNNAFELGPWVDVCYCGDRKWLDHNLPSLSEFPGLVVTCDNEYPPPPSWIKRINRSQRSGLDLDHNYVSWGGNTGASAINLAVHFGVRRIVLLGYDLHYDFENRLNNWHNQHRPFSKPVAPAEMNFRYHKFLQWGFMPIPRAVERLGLDLEIINANPESKLDLFPKVKLEDVLK